MKPEEKERALKAQTKPPAAATTPPEAPKQPPTNIVPPPTQLPRVTAVRGSKSEQDILATQMYLDAYATKDGFKCPRCPYLTADADDFIFHLSDEINKHIASLANLP